MTQEEALKVKHLAKSMVEALGVIAGEKCFNCKGKGKLWYSLKGGNKPQKVLTRCWICRGTGKLGWKWKPKVGEWCVVWDKAVLIYRTYDDKVIVNLGTPEHRAKNVIPILHWEEIERVLEGVGYKIDTARSITKKYYCSISLKGKHITVIYANIAQEAVMKAVISLGKDKVKEE